jgi:TonB-linked outer membrane protein, SusC/RagA family
MNQSLPLGKLLFSFAFMFFSLHLAAQQTISGRVVAGDSAIAGATVQIKGTTQFTETDGNGSFSINAPANATLIVSSVGYITQEIKPTGRSMLVVTLQLADQELGEVVVIGYGAQKKATLTGSVATVSGREITKSPSPNVTNNLAGRLPGLIVNQRSGEPGRDDPNILIRGNTVITSDPNRMTEANAPLVIIDGVPRSSMSRLNPNDIESISVLKDASAAIYGARAANGVILITTKRGKKGKPTFDFSYNYAFQSPTKIPDVLDAATFAEVYNEAEWYRQGRPSGFTPFFTDEAIQKFRDGSDPVLYPNTDWVGEVLKPYSSQQQVNMQVTGGSEAVRYLLSFGTTGQDGNFRNDPTRFRQYNIRANIDVALNSNLSLSAAVYTTMNNRKYSPIATNVNLINIIQANPTIVARYPNGLIGPGRLGENPLLIDQRGLNTLEDFPVNSTFTATYKIPWVKGLRLDASYNYDIQNQFEKSWSIPYYYYEYNVNTKEYERKQGTGTAAASLSDTYRKWTTMLYNFRITYDKTFRKDHHIALMLGNEQQKNTFSFASAFRKNFVSTAIDQINVGSNAAADKDNSGSASAGAYNNYFGHLNYDFKSKYLFEFVFRYDGSQTFPKGNRYGFFPGVSAGWRLSEEPFIQNSLPFVDQLKLRASYGESGNDRVPQWQYLQAFSFGDNYVFGTADVAGIYPNTMPNPNITWDLSKKTDIGLEGSLWNGLLGFELIYWMQKRTDILYRRNLSVSNVFGFPGLPDENIGQVNSRGFEMQLRHRNHIGKLQYGVTGNAALAKSEIIFMDETPQAEPYQTQTGHPIGSALYYKADGIFRTQEELDAYPHDPGTQVGDIRVLDLNKDGTIDSKDQFRFDYSATPQITFGLNTDFQYGNFDLNIFFLGQTRAYKYDATASVLGTSDFANAYVSRAKDRWSVNNPNGTMPRADHWAPGNTTFFLYDATYVRLKSVQLGYTIPRTITSRIRFSDIRLYVSAFNLLTWAREIKWTDPEVNGNINAVDPANPAPYPPQRVINLGINVKF